MIASLSIFFALPFPLPPRTCVPGPIPMLAACDFDATRTCDADVACEGPLRCWAVTQLDGRRGCTMPVKPDPLANLKAFALTAWTEAMMATEESGR